MNYNEEFAQQNANIDARDPQMIMAKLQAQEAAEKILAAKKLEEQQKKLAEQISQQPQITPVHDNVPQDFGITPSVTNPSSERKGTKDRIAELEAKLGVYDSMPTGKVAASSYLDEFGEESYYIENISNGHVVISDLDMEKIKRGDVIDLLKQASLEEIKKSRDIRVALSGSGKNKKLLKRLTPEEFERKLEIKLINQQKIENFRATAQLRAQANPNQQPEKVRPIIESKLEKLSLGYGNEPHRGISPVEFMEWVATETLSVVELDHIYGSVQDRDVKMFVNEKKKQLL